MTMHKILRIFGIFVFVIILNGIVHTTPVIAEDVIFDIPSTCVIGTDLVIKGTSTGGDTVDIAIDDTMIVVDISIDEKGKFIKKFPTGRETILRVPGTYKIKAYVNGPRDRNGNLVKVKIGERIPEGLGIVGDGSTKVMMTEPTLTAHQSTDFVVQGNTYSITGTAPGSDYVDIVIIGSKGSYGVGMDGGYGITVYNVPVSKTDYTFSKTITIDKNADNGRYITMVLSTGRDGFYGHYSGDQNLTIAYLVTSGIFDLKTQSEVLDILKDKTVHAVGSDDLAQETTFIVGHEIAEFKPPETSLTAEHSSDKVALGDNYRISGTCYGSDFVNIVTISPKGASGNATDGTKPSFIIYTLPVENHRFSKRIPIDKNADTGGYSVIVLTPGRNGIYDGIGTSDLEKGLNEKYGDLAYNWRLLRERSQPEIISIIYDATIDAAGSDDLAQLLQVGIGYPYIKLNPINDVAIGEILEVTGETNREDETPIRVEVIGWFEGERVELPLQVVKVINGTFNAKFDTSDAVAGAYIVSTDDGEGYTDEVYLNIDFAVPKSTPVITPVQTSKVIVTPTPSQHKASQKWIGWLILAGMIGGFLVLAWFWYKKEEARKSESKRAERETDFYPPPPDSIQSRDTSYQKTFDTAQKLANEATKLFEGKEYEKSLKIFGESLKKFKEAVDGAKGLKDEGLVKAIGKDIYNVKKSITACKNAIGISFSEDAKKSFDVGNYESAISAYKNSITKFEDALKDAKEIEEHESVERIEGLIKRAEDNIENCHTALDKREVENLFKKSKSLHEKAVELARSGEMFNAKGVLKEAEEKINSAFEISMRRKFSDAANKLSLLLKTIRDEMNVIDKNIASGIHSVDFSADIFKVKKEGKPEIEIPIEKKERALTIERAIYDPCKGDFIEGRLPRMKEWINRYDKGAYWFAISIQNNTDKEINEWDVEIKTSSALKIKEAKIEGIEERIPQESHLGIFKLSVSKAHGYTIPERGQRRVYFKLRAEKPKTTYEISGIFKSAITGNVPIRAKEFKYLCDAGSLKGAILEQPEAALEYVKTQVNYYSPAEVSAIVKGLDIVFEIGRICASRYPKRADVRSEVENLKGYLENVEDKLGQSYNDFEMLVREMDAVLFEETVPEKYAEKIKRNSLAFPDDLLAKLQRQSIESGG